jgi:hypothetical protein
MHATHTQQRSSTRGGPRTYLAWLTDWRVLAGVALVATIAAGVDLARWLAGGGTWDLVTAVASFTVGVVLIGLAYRSWRRSVSIRPDASDA